MTELGGMPMLFAVTGLGAAWLLVRREWRAAALLLSVT